MKGGKGLEGGKRGRREGSSRQTDRRLGPGDNRLVKVKREMKQLCLVTQGHESGDGCLGRTRERKREGKRERMR